MLALTLFVGSCLLLIYAGVNIVQALQGSSVRSDAAGQVRQSLYVKDMQVVDKALKAKMQIKSFSFSGNFEAPFRLQNAVEQRDRSFIPKQPAAPVRPVLIFRGILQKQNPLAIIEDEAGKSFICKVGEEIVGQKLVKIEPGRITLSDARGSYTLTPPGE
jgi:hypothetical protein